MIIPSQKPKDPVVTKQFTPTTRDDVVAASIAYVNAKHAYATANALKDAAWTRYAKAFVALEAAVAALEAKP